MKKTITAIAAGLLLVAGQAAAAQGSATIRVADRVGATAGDSSELSGPVLPGLILGAAIIIGFAVVVNDASKSN